LSVRRRRKSSCRRRFDWTCGGLGYRKENPKFGSFPGLAVDLNPPAMIGYDAVNDGQPEPGALADIFGREEGLEYPIPCLGIHAAAGIRDPKNDASAGAP
jgi:hypothetical protein